MTNDNATCLAQAERFAWPRAFGIVLSCAVAAFAVGSTTAAYAEMGESLAATKLTLTPTDDTVQRYCTLGDACGNDSNVSGNFGGIWRDATFVEPDPRSFPGIRFIGKVISANQTLGGNFDVYCSTEGGGEACVRLREGGSSTSGLCHGIIDVKLNDCSSDFDYKLEYGKTTTTVLKTCKSNVSATCLADDSALVTSGKVIAYRALFDYDCVRYCYGGCCRF